MFGGVILGERSPDGEPPKLIRLWLRSRHFFSVTSVSLWLNRFCSRPFEVGLSSLVFEVGDESGSA